MVILPSPMADIHRNFTEVSLRMPESEGQGVHIPQGVFSGFPSGFARRRPSDAWTEMLPYEELNRHDANLENRHLQTPKK